MTTKTRSVEESCADLFAVYPLAVESEGTGAVWMTLILPGPKFMQLLLKRDGSPAALSNWAEGSATLEDALAGVPLPRDGSLFGYATGGRISALVAVYTDEEPDPTWSSMPLASADPGQWPPFAGKPLFGMWFWDCVREGSLIDLGPVLSRSPGAVFWADTVRSQGSGTTVVASDLRVGRVVLPRGVYVYYRVLRDRKAVPSLEDLLARRDLTDLAPRFSDAGGAA